METETVLVSRAEESHESTNRTHGGYSGRMGVHSSFVGPSRVAYCAFGPCRDSPNGRFLGARKTSGFVHCQWCRGDTLEMCYVYP